MASMSVVSLAKRVACTGVLVFGVAACGNGGDGFANVANPEAACTSNITRLQAALQPGGGAATATAAGRTAAEDELNEAIDARGQRDWPDCLDALAEAFEALRLPRGF